MKIVSHLACLFSLSTLVAAYGTEPTSDSLELFAAVKANEIEAKFIPSSETKANVLITNQTDRVLQIRLPDAIAAVPILGQFGDNRGLAGAGLGLGGPGLGGPGGGGQGGGGTQAVGGAFGNGNQGMGNQGFGGPGFGGPGFGGPGMGGPGLGMGRNRNNGQAGGFMRIAPGKTRKLTATTVCFEYGKPEPNPRIAYRLVPIEQFSNRPEIREMCRELGCGTMRSEIAQAIAWHLLNDMSWESLAEINRVESRYLGSIKYFDQRALETAQQWIEQREPNEVDPYET